MFIDYYLFCVKFCIFNNIRFVPLSVVDDVISVTSKAAILPKHLNWGTGLSVEPNIHVIFTYSKFSCA